MAHFDGGVAFMYLVYCVIESRNIEQLLDRLAVLCGRGKFPYLEELAVQ